MLHNYRTLNWVESNGGPLLLLARDLLPFWFGTRPHDLTESNADWNYDVNSDCDYNRACRIEDYLGLISVGDGEGLVLGDEPLSTTWWPSTNLLVRWQYAESEAEVFKTLSAVPDALWRPTNLIFRVSTNPLCLFDSAYPGSKVQMENSEPLIIELMAGEYSVLTAEYEPNEDTSLLLHRFMRA